MSTPKGFPSQTKEDRVLAQHSTVEPIGQSQYGMSVLAHSFHYVVGTDAAEAGSTVYRVVATSHAVLKGDAIRFTSGSSSGREIRVHAVVDANSFDLVESLASAPGVGDAFQILRNKAPVINADGTLFTSSAGDLTYRRDAVSTFVSEDTVTPANSRPLPVKLVGVTGDLTITASQLNVELSHSSDSVRIGDGTDIMAVNADGSINVNLSGEAATAADGGALPAVQKVIAGYDGAAVQVIKTDASGELQVDVLSQPALSQASNSVAIGDGTDIIAISAAGEASVVVTQPLPAGTNNIGDVDVLSQPARSHTADSIRIGDGTDLMSVTAAGEAMVSLGTSIPAGTNNIGDVDVLTQPARSHTTDSIRVGDGTDLLLITAAGEAMVSLGTALPAGTNNIGDVDVLTMPGQFAEDSAHVSGDLGNLVLGVRNDNGATTFTSADGDYSPIAVTSSGAVRVAANFTATNGAAALPSQEAVIAGWDGTNVRAVKTDAAGELQIDVLSVVPGTSASNLGKAEDAPHASGDVGVMSLGVRSDAGGAFGADGDYVPLSINAAGELRVTTAATVAFDVVDFLDTPLLDASSTNIPASASTPVTVVASLAAAVKKVQFLDTTGSFIGLYSDPAGTPVLEAVFGPGSDQTIEVSIPAATVLGLRNMENSVINTGLLSVNFIG